MRLAISHQKCLNPGQRYKDGYNASEPFSENYNYSTKFFEAFMTAVYPGLPFDENPAKTIEFLASEQPEQEGWNS